MLATAASVKGRLCVYGILSSEPHFYAFRTETGVGGEGASAGSSGGTA